MKNLFISLLLGGIVLFWFSDCIFFNNIFVHGDLFRYFYPLRDFGTSSIKNLHIPLWIPYISCGKPFFAALQSVVFYPISLVYYLSSSFGDVFNWYIIIHFFLAGIFMLFLMRHWGFSRPSSFCSCIIFTFSGYLSSVINMNTSLSSAIWTPLILLFFDKAIKEKRFKYILITAILLGFQFLGGEPTLIYCSFWILLGYSLCFKGLKFFVMAFGLFFILFMFQILPFVEFLNNSNLAGGRSLSAAARWSVRPFELLGFIIPFTWSDIPNHQLWLLSFYMGAVVILFLFFIRPDKKVYFFSFVFIVSLLLALGSNTPIYPFLYKYLPGLSDIRYPVKFVSISTLSLSILAGMGFESLLKKQRSIMKLIIINFLVALLFLYFKDIRYLCQFFIIYTIATFLIVSYLKDMVSKRLFPCLILALAIADLAGVNMGINRTMDKRLFYEIPESVEKVVMAGNSSKGLFRIYQMEDIWEINRSVFGADYGQGVYDRKKTFAANTAIQYGISDVMGYDSIEVGDVHNFIMFLKSLPQKRLVRLLDLLNVRYIISSEPISEPGFSVIYKDTIAYEPLMHNGKVYSHFYINENSNYMERTFLVDDWVIEKDRSIVLGIMQNENFDPRKVVILEEDFQGPGVKGAEGECRILSYKPEEVIIEVEVTSPKFLVLSDTYYPGWKVYVDGKLDKIYKADYFLRAVYLEAGRHIVRFVYEPFSLKRCIKVLLRY